MGTANYLAAARAAAAWDGGLRTAMEDAGVAVEDELVLDDLLTDPVP